MHRTGKRRRPAARGGGPDAADWAREKLGLEADAAQARVLRTKGKRVILNCTRQWGKSTVTAAKALHHAATTAGSLTIVASPSARQSAEFVRKAVTFARRLGMRARSDGSQAISLVLPNGSRIVGIPGRAATVRGFSAVSLLIVDEAARVDDELYQTVRPMLAVSDGALWLMSTPNGKQGFFWETWEKGGEDWERVRVTAEECPRIPQSFLEEERRTMGEAMYAQEYGCEFRNAERGVFDPEVVAAAFTDEVEPLRI
ncbi:MAG: hypothetical protein IT580_01850 [Verrucomicrobiales bacterium]|nr:hypothetical protein [Verrucomicrobiales bacterium]